MERFSRFLIVSLMVHLIVFGSFALRVESKEVEPPKIEQIEIITDQNEKKEIIEEVFVDAIESDFDSGEMSKNEESGLTPSQVKCFNQGGVVMTGIGVEFSLIHKQSESGLVDKVVKGSPAEKAGLKAGDLIENPYSYRGQPKGAVIPIKFYRQNKAFESSVQIDELCIQ